MKNSDRPKCGAKKRSGEGYCERIAGHGTDHLGVGHCKYHGGATKTQRTAAKKEIARRAVAEYALPREIEPHDALIEELHRAAGAVAWLQSEIAHLERVDTAIVGEGGGVRYEPNVLIRMLAEERDRMVRVAKTCIDVGVEERKVQAIEAQARVFAMAIRGILSDLGVRPDAPETAVIVRRHLAAVSVG